MLRRIIAIAAVLTVLALLSFPVSALHSGLETTSAVSSPKRIANSMLLTYNAEENVPFAGIICIDVNESGNILVMFNSGNHYYINVYQTDGTYKYGYSFTIDKGSCAAEWDGNNINICNMGSYEIVSVGAGGNAVDAAGISNTARNRDHFRNTMLSAEKTFSGGKVEMKRSPAQFLFGILSGDHSSVTFTDNDGAERVIVDVSAYVIIQDLIVVAVLVIFAVLFFFVSFKFVRRRMTQV